MNTSKGRVTCAVPKGGKGGFFMRVMKLGVSLQFFRLGKKAGNRNTSLHFTSAYNFSVFRDFFFLARNNFYSETVHMYNKWDLNEDPKANM